MPAKIGQIPGAIEAATNQLEIAPAAAVKLYEIATELYLANAMNVNRFNYNDQLPLETENDLAQKGESLYNVFKKACILL